MTPGEGSTAPALRRGGGVGRVAAIGALALVVIAIVFILFSGGEDGTRYRLLFETGGQLVEGNEVLVGGQPVGTIDDVKLRDDGQAQVDITVERELHEGTSAVIRATSLSGIANRYISLTPGPDNAPVLPDDSLITQVDTTTPVDLDQLFNTLREQERKALQDIIQGSAQLYAGRGEEANETYKYLSPSLTAADKLISELNADEAVLTDFLVSGSRVVTSVAERRDDLVNLVSNGNQALGAIASQNVALDRALRALPPALRQANTTFFNLRPALDDLDQLVDTAKPATKNLYPFLKQLRPLVGKSVPVFEDLRLAVNREGKNNDLTNASKQLVPLRKAADSAVEPTIQAMQDSEPTLTFLRPYSPDLLTAIGKLGQISASYDADGKIVRVQVAALNIFTRAGGILNPIPASQQFADYGAFGTQNYKYFARCPGGMTQPAADGSSPFLDNGMLTTPVPPPTNDCTVTDVPPGP
jgi:phospholipid/cholesterol/gamma-HCH transport system substrate-binding protein